MTFDSEVTIGQLATALSVLVATLTLYLAALKERNLRIKEYANRIRDSAAETSALLDRWRHLSLRLYDDIQPVITDADILLVKEQDVVKTRDELWRNLSKCRIVATQRVTDEKIEIAYVKLYGYDSNIRELFAAVSQAFRTIDEDHFDLLMKRTQANVMSTEKVGKLYTSANLGNELRETAATLHNELNSALAEAASGIHQTLIALIESDDYRLAAGKKI